MLPTVAKPADEKSINDAAMLSDQEVETRLQIGKIAIDKGNMEGARQILDEIKTKGYSHSINNRFEELIKAYLSGKRRYSTKGNSGRSGWKGGKRERF